MMCTAASGASLSMAAPTRRSLRLRRPPPRLRVPPSPGLPKAPIQMPAGPVRRPCRYLLARPKNRSAWATAFFTARRQAARARAAMARTRGEVPRRRLLSRVIGSLVTAASNRSRKRSSMACRTRAITKFRCHPRVAHRCRIPTSPPWPPMSGLSAIAKDKVASHTSGRIVEHRRRRSEYRAPLRGYSFLRAGPLRSRPIRE